MNDNIARIAWMIIKGALLSSTLLTFVLWGNWLAIVFVWLCAIPVTLGVALCVDMVLNAMGKRFDLDEPIAEEEYVAEIKEDTMVKSDAIVGRYQDTNIHEWITVDHPEDKTKRLKLVWDATVDPHAFEAPSGKWWAVLMPGLLYVEPEISSQAEGT